MKKLQVQAKLLSPSPFALKMKLVHLQDGPKMAQFFWYALTSSNINRFSQLFHCQNQEKTCNNTVTKDPPHLKCVATLPCKMSSVLKQQLKRLL